ncbi:MAG: disulfide bond formation protein B [Pollutimonas bauzanensis]|uniref:Thiol:disulfide interchange protein DsbB n=1 Tax=Pollutimonas bauzanensis TaxID=658167 RepID=A0A1M5WJU6_9BURK|nr:disulfide bond formation protein B [Pollutimonas bauzanensis]SHH87849.1 Thiol:disulfide interchange protein DsbB [Pollutimonas bauzanensis]
MNNIPSRLLHLIALLCVAAVAIALVSQHVFGMQPCAWCVLQRLVFLAIAAVCWLGLLLGRRSAVIRRVAALLAAALSAGGATAAWYQYTVAANMFSCDMTFADRFMVKTGLDAHLPWLFGIFASCMDARVDFFGLEYALWGLGLFVVTGMLALISAFLRLSRAASAAR